KNSVILMEQIRTIDKSRLLEKITSLDGDLMDKVNQAIEISLNLVDL
ncbi:MAG: type II toxin-antitoxin system PemK/MazF family toxin, partial [Desulfotomaculaceae bacterium]